MHNFRCADRQRRSPHRALTTVGEVELGTRIRLTLNRFLCNVNEFPIRAQPDGLIARAAARPPPIRLAESMTTKWSGHR
jgi:hypothetical protein